LWGVRGSRRNYIGAVAARVQVVENPGTTERIDNHSGIDSFAMAVVGDHIRMMFERFPENVQGKFKIDKSNTIAIKYTSSNSGIPEFCLSSELHQLRQDAPHGNVAEYPIQS
jgi:hypothetical protein